MGVEHVVRLGVSHIPSLLPRLAQYGAYGLRTRSLLLMLHKQIVPCPLEIFTTAGPGCSDAVLLTVLRTSARHAVLDVCGREDAASRRQLDRLLRSPQLSGLWSTPFRSANVAVGLADVLAAAAGDSGHRVTFSDDVARLYRRPAQLPPPQAPVAASLSGVSVRPLEQRHLARVRTHWPFAAQCPDTDAVLREATVAGLSVGAFLGNSADDQPVSWNLVKTRFGDIGFAHTEPEHRGRGLIRLVLTRMVTVCDRWGIPSLLIINDDNTDTIRSVQKIGFVPEHQVIWRNFAPPSGDSSNVA